MSYATTPPPAAVSSSGGILGYLLLTPNVFTNVYALPLAPGTYAISATASVKSDNTSATAFEARIQDTLFNNYVDVFADLAAGGVRAVLGLTPLRVVLPVATTLTLQVQTTTVGATTAGVAQRSAGQAFGSWLFAEPCS